MVETQVLGGRYRLLERLGGGGMSVVWRAYDEVLGRYVAVKVLADAGGLWPRERIRREAQAAARLSHPHVTAVHDYGGEPTPFVVMELLSGHTLAQRMASGPVPPGEALRITAEVATALAAAHAHDLVHCDIKPANIMLTPAGAKVLDFGITAAAGNQGEPGPHGLVVGTPSYLAPERFDRGEVSPAADVYGLGLILYRLLAGGPPWPARSIPDWLEAHRSLPPEPLPATVPVPAEVAAACLRCLAKEPDERPTAYELAVVLAEAEGWRVVPASGGGIVVVAQAPAGAALRVVGRVRRRLRKAPTVPRHRAPVGPPVPGGRDWRRRAARITAAAVVGVVGLVAGWGLPDAVVDRHRPGVSEAAPPVPRDDPSVDPTPAPPIESPEEPDEGTNAVSRGSAGGSGQVKEEGAKGGQNANTPAPPKTTPPPAPEPTPTPKPKPPPTSAAAAPVEQVRTLVTTAGTVVVRCVGATASIVSVSPLAGFGIFDIDRGPGAEVSVALRALLLTVRVTVTCSSGIPQPSIQLS